MSEFNFDKLKNHEIPDSWVRGAINVPPEKEKPPIILSKAPKMLAFAATFVVVCALSVTLFIFTQKGAVLPMSNETQKIVETTSETESLTEQTEDNTKQNAVESTAPTEPTDAPEESVEQSENQKEEPKPSINPTNPSVPTTEPTTPSTEPDSSPSDSTDDPDNPSSNPDSAKPGSGSLNGGTVNKTIRCYATITINEYLADGEIFCKISSHNLGGNGTDRFPPDKRRATATFSNGFVDLKYELDNENGELEPGEYEYFFYNSKGDILSRGTITVY